MNDQGQVKLRKCPTCGHENYTRQDYVCDNCAVLTSRLDAAKADNKALRHAATDAYALGREDERAETGRAQEERDNLKERLGSVLDGFRHYTLENGEQLDLTNAEEVLGLVKKAAECDRLRTGRDALRYQIVRYNEMAGKDADELARLRDALRKIHEGATGQLAEPRSRGDDQFALTQIATEVERVLDVGTGKKGGVVMENAETTV